MLRRTVWRNTVSDAVSLHQDEALSTTMFLLKSYGPTGFLLREEGEARSFKVNPSACCFLMSDQRRRHSVVKQRALWGFNSFQRGLMERQIFELLHGLHQTEAQRTEFEPVYRKAINAQDVCPICQEDLLERKQPVSYCRFGCGNNIHISCMKVWAEHQKRNQDQTVKCPLYREDFSSLKLLQEQLKNAAKLFTTAAERQKADSHLGVVSQLQNLPGNWKMYFYLCEDCAEKRCQPQHPLASRTVKNMFSNVPPPVLSVVLLAADPLPDVVLKCLPAVRLRSGSRLLDEGQQCRIGLQSFILGQHVQTLPCRHQFHSDCVDQILQKSNSCPVDGYVIYNPLTWRSSQRKASCLSSDSKKPESTLKDTQKLTDRFLDLCASAADCESNQTGSSSFHRLSA
uniref:Zinc finger, SWIM-type containing 2 n=1 Tax=Acanthochromis polyacanthus TaxID=80966 RepID=A0A3Q1FEZ5_9TELE